MQPAQEEKENIVPVPLHVAKRRVYTASADDYLPPLSLGDGLSPDYQYLLLLYRFHYLTVKQVSRLLGKTIDWQEDNVGDALRKKFQEGLLTRQPITGGITKAGRVPYVYSLSDKGVEKLKKELSISPGTRKGTFSEHTLLVNDALISLILASKQEPSIRLVDLKHERAFKQQNIPVGDSRFLEPDGFLHFQLSPPFGGENESVGVCLEIDLGSESKLQWKEKVDKYLAFTSGVYQERFGLKSLTIAVCRPGGNIRQLKDWTEEVVKLKKEYAELFIFTDSNPVDCDPVEWVTSPLWQQPFDSNPHALIEKQSREAQDETKRRIPLMPEKEAAPVQPALSLAELIKRYQDYLDQLSGNEEPVNFDVWKEQFLEENS